MPGWAHLTVGQFHVLSPGEGLFRLADCYAINLVHSQISQLLCMPLEARCVFFRADTTHVWHTENDRIKQLIVPLQRKHGSVYWTEEL